MGRRPTLSPQQVRRNSTRSTTMSYPGKISLKMPVRRGQHKHPAIKIVETKDGSEVQNLEFIGSGSIRRLVQQGTAPQPFDIFSDDKTLLRQPTTISKLTIWLPVGLSYRSTWGRFDLAADGTVRFDQGDVTQWSSFHRKRLYKKQSAAAVLEEGGNGG